MRQSIPIKAIICDVAGVMLHPEDEGLIRWCVRAYNIKREVFEPVYLRLQMQYERDKYNEKEYLKRLFRELRRPLDKNFLNKKFSYKRKNPAVMKLVKALNKKLPVYYLTNEGRGYWQKTDKKYRISSLVTKGFASYQFGSRKPARRLFQAILKKIRCRPSEVIFIDDSKANVEGGRKIGFHAIQFRNLAQLKKELKKFGVST